MQIFKKLTDPKLLYRSNPTPWYVTIGILNSLCHIHTQTMNLKTFVPFFCKGPTAMYKYTEIIFFYFMMYTDIIL